MEWSPPDFDYQAEVSRFKTLTAQFQDRYQGLCRIQTGTEIQDAFFHGALRGGIQPATWIFRRFHYV